MRKRSACFFARVGDRAILDRVEFYAQDLRVLRELGFDVHVATTIQEIRPADFYFVWWWTWAFFPVCVARMLRRPVIVTGVFDNWMFTDRHPAHQAMMRYALRHATSNVFVSQLEHKEVPAQFAVADPCYVPLTVDTDVYVPGSTPREDFALTVGWMQDGNAQRKGMPEVIRAAAKLRGMGHEMRFIMAGEHGTYYPTLVELAKDLGVADLVEFPGAISLADKIRLMQRCRVYLQPSRFEGFGLAILEAMSCGAPVITSAVGAVPEVVGEAAILVDGTSPDSIAGGVKYLLEACSVGTILGEKARARAETLYPHARRQQELRELIQQVVEKA
jgi:glycosyltransferase involved in cell wall biosynthesis